MTHHNDHCATPILQPSTEFDELYAQGGVLRALAHLAEQIRESGDEVAAGVEGVAWALDRERRGAMSVGALQDPAELGNTIEKLLGGDLLDREGLAQVRQRILEHLQPKPAPVVEPPAAARKAPKRLPKPRANPERRAHR